MPPRLAFGQHVLLVGFGQANVAMSGSMNVHEHGSSHKEGIFVNAGILPLGNAWQCENSLTQFFMELTSRFPVDQCRLHGPS